ncbi:hypothetical protein ZWY2020_001918 [Hordeum vulgare]|nr:hypothetical protein ZWY2020_001918 [Hordeum vulgare]
MDAARGAGAVVMTLAATAMVVNAADALVVLLGSGSSSTEAARASEKQPLLAVPLETGRGRSLAWHPSPGATRRRSQDALTSQESPTLSPTTILPPAPRSKRSEACSGSLMPAAPSQALLQLCEPPSMLLSVLSPSSP